MAACLEYILGRELPGSDPDDLSVDEPIGMANKPLSVMGSVRGKHGGLPSTVRQMVGSVGQAQDPAGQEARPQAGHDAGVADREGAADMNEGENKSKREAKRGGHRIDPTDERPNCTLAESSSVPASHGAREERSRIFSLSSSARAKRRV